MGRNTGKSPFTIGLKWNSGKSFWQNYQALRSSRGLKFASDVTTHLYESGRQIRKAARNDRSVLVTMISSAFGLLDKVADLIEDVDVNFFDSHGWVTPFSSDFSGLIYEMYRSLPRTIHERSKNADNDNNDMTKISFVEIAPGVEIGWEDLPLFKSAFYHVPVKIYCDSDHVEDVRRIVSEQLWEKYKNVNVIVVKRVSRQAMSSDDDYNASSTSYLSFKQDDVHSLGSSARTELIAKNYSRAFSVGLSRSLMLEGPPGTGKSTMAQMLIKKLELRALRICVEDIDPKFVPSIMESVKIFKPDAIIIDDFDRCTFDSQACLLELSEWFKQTAKLTIVTVNDKNALDQALLRPGRFDEIVTIKSLDDESIREMLGPYADEAIDLVRDWPVAYIKEYCLRRQYASIEEAEASISELRDRVARLFEAYDENDGATPFIGKRRASLVQKR